ncbi:MAG: enoyl-CoA hydratase/isomerase family protein, partial [Proteobacteria bacterium]|nr:enoyl-CoA hydratase/isomerase family protein [Pseudomonadota bacterium]
AEALSLGLINQNPSVENLDNSTDQFVDEILKMKALSLASTKKLLWHDHVRIENLLDLEKKLFIEQAQTSEAMEGMSQFLKRD